MIETILSILILWLTLSGGIYGLFYAIEKTVNKKAKIGATEWLKSMAERSISKTIVESPRWFIEAFDSVFGEKHLTWRCFRRSCIASVIAVFVMAIFSFLSDPISWQIFSKSEPVARTLGMFIAIFIMAMFLNFIPDYISLLETRWILGKTKNSGIKKLLLLLILDVILTGGIFFLGTLIFVIVLGVLAGNFPHLLDFTFNTMFENFNNLLKFPLYIFFYAAYFTSIWFYFFIASSIITNIAYSLGRFGNCMINWLDLDKKPFQSMGLISVALCTGLLVLALIIREIMSFSG